MMTIYLSQIKGLPFDFEAEVKKFVQAKKDHLLTEGEPAPTHHHWVENAVRRIATPGQPDDFAADYTIVDDLPPPPTLDEKKKKLADQVNMQAFELTNQITPPLKQKLFQFQVNDAVAARTTGDITEAQKAVLADWAERDRKTQAIYRHAAELESQIHDLTEDQVDVWQGAPFPAV